MCPGVDAKVFLAAEALVTLATDVRPLVRVCADVDEHFVPERVTKSVLKDGKVYGRNGFEFC